MSTTVVTNSLFIALCLTIKYLLLCGLAMLIFDIILKIVKSICVNSSFLMECFLSRATYKSLKKSKIMKAFSKHIVISPTTGILQNNIEINKQKEMLEDALDFINQIVKEEKSI